MNLKRERIRMNEHSIDNNSFKDDVQIRKQHPTLHELQGNIGPRKMSERRKKPPINHFKQNVNKSQQIVSLKHM